MVAGDLLGLLLLGLGAQASFAEGALELLALAGDRMAIAIDHAQRSAQGRDVC